jgi:DNA-nicking Smr family endonuclease
MKRPSSRTLSEEDRILWNQVAATAKPLHARRAVETLSAQPQATPPAPSEEATAPSAPPAAAAERPKRQHVQHHLDDQTHDKLAKGRLPIEGRVDLHGLTQDAAHALLLGFLSSAQRRGIRYVLVITGKGSSSGGDGVLRRSVPAWLRTAPFRPLVSSHDHAARNHGGAGALYVRLRRTQ